MLLCMPRHVTPCHCQLSGQQHHATPRCITDHTTPHHQSPCTPTSGFVIYKTFCLLISYVQITQLITRRYLSLTSTVNSNFKSAVRHALFHLEQASVFELFEKLGRFGKYVHNWYQYCDRRIFPVFRMLGVEPLLWAWLNYQACRVVIQT